MSRNRYIQSTHTEYLDTSSIITHNIATLTFYTSQRVEVPPPMQRSCMCESIAQISRTLFHTSHLAYNHWAATLPFDKLCSLSCTSPSAGTSHKRRFNVVGKQKAFLKPYNIVCLSQSIFHSSHSKAGCLPCLLSSTCGKFPSRFYL